MENNLLTLVYPLYKPSKGELKNIKTILELKNNFDILLLSDNPEINNELETYFTGMDIAIVSSNRNIGKFEVVNSAVKNGFVKTKWFKVCDPDDLILVKNIEKFNKKFSKVKSSPLIRMIPSKNISTGYNNEQLNSGSVKNAGIKNRYLFSLVNENTIHPTEDLYHFPHNLPNQTKSSDVLFSMASYEKGKPKIARFKKSFYYYQKHNGISNPENPDPSLRNIIELETFLDFMIENNHKNKMRAPSFFDFKWAHTYLINQDIPQEESVKILNSIFNKLKICAKENKKWKIKWDDDSKNKFIKMLEDKEKI